MVIIAGTRTFDDYDRLKADCDRILLDVYPNDEHITIMSGGASGAGTLGERYAAEKDYAVIHYRADWTNHGKAAGPIRNSEMVRDCDYAIVFWDSQSRGTLDLIKKLNTADKPRAVVFIQTKAQPVPEVQA
jgi:hypothetical protein